MASQQQTQLRFLYFLSSIFSLILACSDDELYVIKSAAYQSLVLDASNPTGIKLQTYNHSSSQLWRFERGDHAGLFFIINKESGKAMDIIPTDHLILVTREPRNILRQQWVWTINGRLTNAENRRNMDVEAASFKPGNRIILWNDNGNQAQEFLLEKFNLNGLQIPT